MPCGQRPCTALCGRRIRSRLSSSSREKRAIEFRHKAVGRPLEQADLRRKDSMLVKEANRTYEVPGDSEQIVRAAWLYHVAGNTQEQTADLLGNLTCKGQSALG